MKVLGQQYDPLIPLVIGTQTAATNAFTGVLPLDELVHGQSIRYWLPYAGVSSTSVTLELTLRDGSTTGAINVYYKGTTRLTTQYTYGSLIVMTYLENANVNGTAYTGWWCGQDYYSNTTNSCGSANTSSKIFLCGRTAQSSTGGTSYSHDTVYVGTDGHVYSNSEQVVNLSDTQALTNKTYNGYTLADACEKGVDTAVTSGSANLPTSDAVYRAIANVAISGGGISTALLWENSSPAATFAAQTVDYSETITENDLVTVCFRQNVDSDTEMWAFGRVGKTSRASMGGRIAYDGSNYSLGLNRVFTPSTDSIYFNTGSRTTTISNATSTGTVLIPQIVIAFKGVFG